MNKTSNQDTIIFDRNSRFRFHKVMMAKANMKPSVHAVETAVRVQIVKDFKRKK
jgi:hypothetical protein